MGEPRRWWPKTIRAQMMIVIVLAVVAVVSLEGAIEPLRKTILPTADTDAIAERAFTIGRQMEGADPAQREWLLASAARLGFEIELVATGDLDARIAASPPLGLAAQLVGLLFPQDTDLSTGARWIVLDGHRALAVPVDGRSVLVVPNLPDVLTNDVVGPLTYYVLSFVILLLLFSFYAAQTVARPIDRIVAELDRTDGIAEERLIPERGTVEVVALARALNGMRTRIRGMIDMRMRMLRSVSHDLRTPLTRLRLRVERLPEGTERDAMISDIERIDALATETLDYLRLDAQGEAEESVDIASLLQTIEADFADVGFDLRYEGPARLAATCRPNALTRAVTNLCDNGVKFGKRVVVSLIPNADTIWIEVADDGPGIPAELRALVTEPFFKIDAARGERPREGFGLGLSIVADIVRAHGGTMSLLARAPHGLVVRLALPLRRRDTHTTSRNISTSNEASKGSGGG
ncbi:hypothetical protein M673_03930 [Aureimonas sp. AU20]|uniref:ATP-binding protein n=2 Tax=Aureimonas sp. AU20 TaxID=1349819 RepID=UPI00071FD94E|nr:ATP-binding protein [Aureimonas sp. AU20]ALN71849.1 hypothetical protein M673_03930 [Aureimonas sp. AU20]